MAEKRQLMPKKVSSVQNIAAHVYVLRFKRDFDFIAGQVVAIDVTDNGQPRLYSIASAEKDEFVDILFDEQPKGRLTPKLSKLKPGDTIYVSEPFGNFNCTDDKAWWIAAGTGIAPFVSMARSGLGHNKMLIHGGRHDENFYFADELQQKLTYSYIRCCSQQADTINYKGRLTNWLKSKQTLPIDMKYYLCGSAEMVVQVRDILISRDVPFHNIISETYF